MVKPSHLAGAAIALVLWPVAAHPQDVPPEKDPVVEEATPALEDLEFSLDWGVVRASHGDRVVWEYVIYPRAEEYELKEDFAGPLLAGDLLCFCGRGSLYEADPVDGVVKRRLHLPGRCMDIEKREGKVAVTVGGGFDEHEWRKTYVIEPGVGEIPFFMSSNLAYVYHPMIQADIVRGPDGEAVDLDDPGLGSALEEAIGRLEALARQDPTNPWYRFKRAEYLIHLGRENEAHEALEEMLEELEPGYDYDLLKMVPYLEEIDPGPADQAFARAMRFLLAGGYEPELMYNLMPVMVHLQVPGQDRLDLVKNEDWRRASSYGDRLYDNKKFHRAFAASFSS